MGKPTIYLDSGIFSALHYRGGGAVLTARRVATRDWWALEMPLFQVWVSREVASELADGTFPGQPNAVAEALRLRHLPFTAAVQRCADTLLEEGIVPASKPGDATHLAFATAHSVDYLLTWNYAHLANADVQERLTLLCRRKGWRTPLLVSPDTIPKAAWGHRIGRNDEQETV
jgi:predicted nucleic acid-binding protein